MNTSSASSNQRPMENPLGVEPVGNLLRRFAVPSIIAMLVSSLYNMVDQLFIGHSIGILGNAATNVAFPLTMTCTSIALLCGIGGAANFNLSLGRKETENARGYVGNTLSMLVILGVILCVTVQIFLRPMMLLFGATPDVIDYACTYTRITSLGFPFLILTTGGSNMIRADGSPRYSMMCNLAGAAVNTILDPLFIFVFQMGMAGAALATILGQIVSAGMVIFYLTRFKSVTLRFLDLKPSLKRWLQIASLGATPCFNQLAMMVVQIVMNNTLTHYGASSMYGSDIPLACAGIISKVNMLFFSFVIGISQGLQPIVSFNYGARKYPRVREAYLKAVAAATVICVIAFCCFQIFPRQIISIFGSGSEEYLHFAERYFRIYLFCSFLNGFQPVTSNFFTSIGKPKKGIFLSLTRQILFLLPLLLIFPYLFGIDGVMYTAPIADFAAACFSIVLVRKELSAMKRLS
ncbi:MAG: MATE family efflux transporter [Fusicatenibacter sp.]|nr:MATE family efflux transporter [Lachnospiraceae bacterium]MDY2937347.1 MATE family efflux transporter [Fusicatenibacter sp.]